MDTYANKNDNSGVIRYQSGSDFIIVEFKPSKYSDIVFYKYSYVSAEQSTIEEMKRLAKQGYGLHTYINTVDVKKHFESKSSSLTGL
jgi:hypothetical protein